MVCSGGDVSTYQKEISDDSDQPSSSLPRLRQHTHRQERAQPQREPTVAVPHLRGEQGAAFQATLQRGAQGRGAASLSGAFLATGTQSHLRDHAQNDHAVVKKNS
jgi:hypothetical protein